MQLYLVVQFFLTILYMIHVFFPHYSRHQLFCVFRSKDIEASGFNGTAAFMEVRVQSIVVEFILTHVPQLFPEEGTIVALNIVPSVLNEMQLFGRQIWSRAENDGVLITDFCHVQVGQMREESPSPPRHRCSIRTMGFSRPLILSQTLVKSAQATARYPSDHITPSLKALTSEQTRTNTQNDERCS